jgi:hypothetical protein
VINVEEGRLRIEVSVYTYLNGMPFLLTQAQGTGQVGFGAGVGKDVGTWWHVEIGKEAQPMAGGGNGNRVSNQGVHT